MYYLIGTMAQIENKKEKHILVYNTEKEKKEVISKDYFKEVVREGNMFGFTKDGIEHNYIEALFKSGKYLYYVFRNIVLVYRDEVATLYDIDKIGYKQTMFLNKKKVKLGKYYSLDFNKGYVTLYQALNNTCSCYEKTSKYMIVKSMNITEEQFRRKCNLIVYTYMVSKEK